MCSASRLLDCNFFHGILWAITELWYFILFLNQSFNSGQVALLGKERKEASLSCCGLSLKVLIDKGTLYRWLIKLWSLLLDFWWGASQGEQIESIGHASTLQERLQELTRLTGQTQRDCMYLRASFFLLFSNCMTWGSPGATFQDYPYL